MKKNNIIINVTSSFNWHSQPVGIIRTETEIVKAMEKFNDINLKLCIWNGKGFEEISFYNYINKDRPSFLNRLLKKIKNQLLFILKSFYIFFKPTLIFLIKYLYKILQKTFLNKIKKNTLIYNYFFNIYLSIFNLSKSYKFKIGLISYSNDFQINTNLFKKKSSFISVGLEWSESYTNYFFHLKEHGINVITMCYDLVPIKFPQYCFTNFSSEFSNFLFNLYYGSTTIITISNTTKMDLKNFYIDNGFKPPRLQIINLGNDLSQNISSSNYLSYEKEYILYVSTIETRKNHRLLLDVYKYAKSLNKKMPILIFAGRKGWGVDDIFDEINKDSYLKENIKIFNNLTDEELKNLYKNSKFCLFPSFYEGFGLPVAEALSFGKFTLCSNISSLKEVGGDMLIYVNSIDYKVWYSRIINLMEDSKKLSFIENKIKKHFVVRTWNHVCKDILKLTL